ISDFSISLKNSKINFDVAFIAIHGAPAETGHLQAYLEMVGIPYTGSGVLTSALTMNKLFCKEIVSSVANIKVPYGKILSQDKPNSYQFIEAENLTFPCIVKPNSYGSGIGVSVVNNKESLINSVEKIRELKQDVLIEEFIDGREITVGAIILEKNIYILPIAEILRDDHEKNFKQNQFYNYTNRQSTEIIISPSIDKKIVKQLELDTKRIGETLNCRSFYRVDYMLNKNNDIYFLEVNTIPGMTVRSVFTKQIEHAGMKQEDIYNRLIIEVMQEQAI
ncbi:MAG TPA: D-alanine--D-alanine ligase, partial [Alphaproteobacteria bacterium]|nr:D-alanine--D-alanine ligase [Alphaproteobacteria bacterium]